MSFSQKLQAIWKSNNSLVCVGLDTDSSKLPEPIKGKDLPLFEFNRAIVDATADLVCTYKIQIAFYASAAAESQLRMTVEYIRSKFPAVPVIVDAKRGDIGNTAEHYAKEVFDRYNADAVTVNPYMGGDSLEPFLSRADRGCIILCKTSNPGSGDLQDLDCGGMPLYMRVAKQASTDWNKNNNVSLVVGATYPQQLKAVRDLVGDDVPLLVPGIGAQGGDLEASIKNGKNSRGDGLMINSSRGIIFASSAADFTHAARREAKKLRDEINRFRE